MMNVDSKSSRAGCLLAFVAVLLVGAGCEGPARLTEAQIEEATAGKPDVFVEVDGNLTLEDTPEFYLGQSEADAMEALEARCEAIVDYEGDWKRSNTFFKGCRLPNNPDVQSIRIGFHPETGNRVFTLEVKRKGWGPKLVRAQFSKRFGEQLTKDVPRRGTVRMETEDRLMFASWDDGDKGPVHLIFGLSPSAVEGLSN